MICTEEYLRTRFDNFNAQCFDGTLVAPRLRIGTSRRMLGSVRYRWVQGQKRQRKREIIALTISGIYDLAPSVLDDIILHEMIHLFIFTQGKDDTSTHGRLFRTMMNDLNTRYGRHITITHRAPLTLAPQQQQALTVAVVTLRDGTQCVIRPAKTRQRQIQRQLARLTTVHHVAWYSSNDPYFATFPRALTLRLFRADSTKLHHALALATPLR